MKRFTPFLIQNCLLAKMLDAYFIDLKMDVRPYSNSSNLNRIISLWN